MKRILVMAEAVTLAHVVRPFVLARGLRDAGFEVYFACADRFEIVFKEWDSSRITLNSVSTEQFSRALAMGKPLYNYSTLKQYVEQDQKVLSEIRPDIVLGDFRLSLAVSATKAKIPYASITNAYWSPYACQAFPVPEHPATRLFGVRAANIGFQLVRPLIFKLHARPLNRLRRFYGQQPLGGLCDVYTAADLSLYADVPSVVPVPGRPLHHHYIGHIAWTPEVVLPPWWSSVPSDLPWIYINLGSSGQVNLLATLVEKLSQLPVQLIVATAGRKVIEKQYPNVWVSDFLPGDILARSSQLVICNGGSPSCYQALAEGTPVIGIPSNLDQHLNMGYVARSGAGIQVRSDQMDMARMVDLVKGLLKNNHCRLAARKIQKEIALYDPVARVETLFAGL